VNDAQVQSVPQVMRYMRWLKANRNLEIEDYETLWQWSVDDTAAFWDSIWSYFDVRASVAPQSIVEFKDVSDAKWFSGARMSFSENVFRAENEQRPALVSITEHGAAEAWSWARLRRETGAFAHYLRTLGVQSGDRVVGYLPNCPEALVGLLAANSLGAVWSVCNQDVSVPGVLARFKQLAPVVLIAADGSRFAGREHSRLQAIAEIQRELTTLKATVIVPRLAANALPVAPGTTWHDATCEHAELQFEQLPFDHPLWVLFSSGTTGAPKGIVHGQGGILLEQYKLTALHFDLSNEDRFFWYCSTSWVMWNVQVCALLSGATIVLYDGSAACPDTGRLWRIVEEHAVTVLGVSPAYLQLCAKDGVTPRSSYSVNTLRSVGCTGSPLPLAAYEWMRLEVGEHIPLQSVSGGTDIAGGFVGGCPTVPVYPGENSVRCLGVAAEAWNETGMPVVDSVGELVITKPMPSMPICFWNDADGARYHESYFSTFPGVWRHGDWVTVTKKGSVIVHGRSDATLNRHGVRLGSAEIYQAVETLPEILESLVLGIELAGGDYWMPLFVQLRSGTSFDEKLKSRIVAAIRASASPRHIPDEIIEVPGIPHTLTGKRLEVPIKRILLGTPVEKALNLGAVDRPELIEVFSQFSAERAKRKLKVSEQV